jgi:hypothetical protein
MHNERLDEEFESPESSSEDEVLDINLENDLPQNELSSPARPTKNSPIAVVFEREYVPDKSDIRISQIRNSTSCRNTVEDPPSPQQRKMSEFEILHNLYKEHLIGIIKNINSQADFLVKSNSTEIGTDIWYKIINILSIRDRYNAMRTCLFLKNLIDKEESWHYSYSLQSKDKAAILKPHERSWKFKLKYYSGFIDKAGIVEKLSGVLWNTWTPCWLVLSGTSLFAFVVPNLQKREKELQLLAQKGLGAIAKKEFQTSHETLNMKQARLFIGKKINTGGFQRFGFSLNNVDHVYRSSEKETDAWISTLKKQLQTLAIDFCTYG